MSNAQARLRLPLFDAHDTYVRVLGGVVAPLGTAVWAFVELLSVAQGWVGGVLLVMCTLGAFLAVNEAVHLTDEQLNGGQA